VAKDGLVVREATDADIAAITAIYAHHVLYGLASFEEVPPSFAEMASRRAAITARGLPYLVAELDGRVAGYSYASTYRPRSGYRFTLEDSVYIAEDRRGHGIGSALLATLIRRCEAGPWRQMLAVIGDSANHGSIGLHRKHGFRIAGTYPSIGFKLGRWVDSVVMQRPLGPGDASLPEPPSAAGDER
jgi:phosphinothricin acetyltransferase